MRIQWSAAAQPMFSSSRAMFADTPVRPFGMLWRITPYAATGVPTHGHPVGSAR